MSGEKQAGSALSGGLGQPHVFPESLHAIQSRICGSHSDAAEIYTLQREVAAWRERFPALYYRSMDDCIERREP